MKSNKILSIAVIALIVINLVLIGFIWFRKTDTREMPPRQGNHHRMLSRQLGFSPNQEQQFQELVNDFRQHQHASAEEIFNCQRLLHQSIFNPSINSDSLLDVIGKLEREHAAELLAHQHEIFLICDDHQKEEFKKLTLQTIRFHGRQRGMRGR